MCCILAILSSCSTSIPMLKQEYNTSKSAVSKFDYDTTWSKVIDFFAENSIPITLIDKSSGIITASNVSVGETLVTHEDKNGEILNPNAWFVMPYVKGCLGNQAICGFNVRVTPVQNENDKVTVTVNLSYTSGEYIVEFRDPMTFRKSRMTVKSKLPCVSTGKFESDLLSLFTN